jgi:hypothetical protein
MAPHNTFVVVDGDVLTPEQKSCLLRAARKELDFLTDELKRMKDLPTRYNQGPIAVVEQEIECLSAGVTWLWKLTEARAPPPSRPL